MFHMPHVMGCMCRRHVWFTFFVFYNNIFWGLHGFDLLICVWPSEVYFLFLCFFIFRIVKPNFQRASKYYRARSSQHVRRQIVCARSVLIIACAVGFSKQKNGDQIWTLFVGPMFAPKFFCCEPTVIVVVLSWHHSVWRCRHGPGRQMEIHRQGSARPQYKVLLRSIRFHCRKNIY